MTTDEDDKETEPVWFLIIPLQSIPHTSKKICDSDAKSSEAEFPTDWRIQGGQGTLPPSRSNLFHFHGVFGNNLAK